MLIETKVWLHFEMQGYFYNHTDCDFYVNSDWVFGAREWTRF